MTDEESSYARFAFYDRTWCHSVENAELCKSCARNRLRVTNWAPPAAYSGLILSQETRTAAIEGHCEAYAKDDNDGPVTAP